jgi:SAM-dependent methyltransferase
MNFFCPACKTLLVDNPHGLHCPNNNCRESSFITSGQCPVLFASSSPFKKSLDQQINHAFESPDIKRYNYPAIFRSLAALIHGKNIITHKNISSVLYGLTSNSKVLIIGGGSVGHGCAPIYERSKGLGFHLYSLDVYASPYVNVLADAHLLPFPSNYFDLVIIQAVLEHLIDPVQAVSEIHRVLDSDGIVYSEVPFMQSVHEGAFDFYRFSLSAHKHLFFNFRIIRSGVHHGPLEAVLFLSSHVIGLLFTRYVRLLFFYSLIRLSRFFDNCFFRDSRACDVACGTYIIGQKSSKYYPPPMSLAYIESLYEGIQR